MKIKKLSESLISKIAAGEVIERPAYVLKELIENSIDAGAKNIIVSVKDYGLSEIAVIDDGAGIEKDELAIAIKPHTTSKISEISDLVKIKSMGFRGEALASITSMSNYEIKSKKKNNKGFAINDKSAVPYPVGMPLGTQIFVKNIFINTPARKKFLSTKQTEYRHILNQFYTFALAYPNINFEIRNDTKKITKIKSETLISRIKNILGNEISNNLLPVLYQDSYIMISGFITHPQINFKSKNKIFIYVNQRRIYNTSLINSIKEGYKHLLSHYAFPCVCLFIKISEDLIDVNVHPRKEIIKFLNEEEIYQHLKESIYNTLTKNNLTFSNLSFSQKLTRTNLANELRDEIMQSPEGKIGKVKKSADIIQLHNLYIVTETENGILLLDQHAVHEAILYYKYMKAYKNRKSKNISYKLKKALVVHLNELESSLVEEHIEYLKKIGFSLELFGENRYKITSVPIVSTDLEPKKNFLQTLKELENNNKDDYTNQIQEMLSYLACRSAIKSGDALTKKQMKELISYLDKIDLGYTCPHGRPVKIELSKNEINSMFKRI